jgi:spoIIIJ-associated protein
MTHGNDNPGLEETHNVSVDAPEQTPQEDNGSGDNFRRGQSRRRQHHQTQDEPAPYEGDERAQGALQFVAAVLQQMGMDCNARLLQPREQEEEGQAPEIVVEVFGRDSGRIIGKRGQVLGALQFLTHRAVNRPTLDRRHVVVDAEGYRLRRESTLASMARRLGQQAVDEGKIITFEPMNPRDRRVVHLALAKFEGVITKSEGEGDERRVQIIPVRR